jgi:hypothetical protein
MKLRISSSKNRKRTVRNFISDTKHCIIADDSNKGKTALFSNLISKIVTLNDEQLKLTDYSYYYEEEQSLSYCVSIFNGSLNEEELKRFNKKLLIFDDITNINYLEFIRYLISELQDTTFIIVSRNFTYANVACYTYDLNKEDNCLIPFLLKKDIPVVDYSEYSQIVIEDSRYERCSNLKEEENLKVKVKSNAYLMWERICGYKQTLTFTYGKDKIEPTIAKLKNYCISVDYSFDNITALSLIKRLKESNEPICNYYSTEMLYIIHAFSIDTYGYSKYEIENILRAILEENTPLELKVREKNKGKTLEHRLKEIYRKMSNKRKLEVPNILPRIANAESIINLMNDDNADIDESQHNSRKTYNFK